MAYITGKFEGFLSTAEAAAIWGKEESTVRKAILRGIFREGETCAKFGKQWVVTAEGMHEWTGDWAPWSTFKARRMGFIKRFGCETCHNSLPNGTCTAQQSWWLQPDTEVGSCPLWAE